MSTDARQITRRRARVTGQGQITVPKAVREALGARPGDELEFIAQGDVVVVAVRRRRSVLEFAGIGQAGAGLVPPDAEELDERVDRGMAEAAMQRERRTRASRPERRTRTLRAGEQPRPAS